MCVRGWVGVMCCSPPARALGVKAVLLRRKCSHRSTSVVDSRYRMGEPSGIGGRCTLMGGWFNALKMRVEAALQRRKAAGTSLDHLGEEERLGL